MFPLLLVVLVALAGSTRCQDNETVPNSYPHNYTGMPSGDFSPEWQDYFLVKDPLPNVTFPLNRSFAGNIPVNRTNHPNDTLFFWAFESNNGSLTSDADGNSSAPWAIWLNGGPGASSMVGLMLENGPLHITENGSLTPNNYSWNKLVDYFWVDQPVGTGFSTAEANGGYITDEDQMGEDFVNFLSNLVKVFPSLQTRPLLLTGESYAGTFIPYITKAIFSSPNPPVNLSRIAIGNGGMGAEPEYEELPILSVIETYPQLIGYDPEVYEYFREQTHLCGYDLNLTYPQTSKLPPIGPPVPAVNQSRALELTGRSSTLVRKTLFAIARGVESPETGLFKRQNSPTRREVVEREWKRREWIKEKKSGIKRDLTGRANGTIDPYYGCYLSLEIQDYALNFSMPWNLSQQTVIPSLDAYGPFNVYNIPDARSPPLALDPTTFFNDNQTRTALHAPTSKNWSLQIEYPFGSSYEPGPGANVFGDPSVEPVAFFDELAWNASVRGVNVIIYSGNDDMVVPHLSSEITIQNTTFGGIQGFTRKPSTPFYDDSGNFAGIVHQERNWTYVLIADSGHEVPEFTPEAAFVLFREFILGNNSTGLVSNSSDGGVSVVGGENSTRLVGDILPGESAILYGSGTATSLYVAPSATIASWSSFFASVQSADAAAASENSGSGSGSSAPFTSSSSDTSSMSSSVSTSASAPGSAPEFVSTSTSASALSTTSASASASATTSA